MDYQPIRSKLDEIAVERGCYYDHSKADVVQRFLETACIQSKHPFNGKPLKLLDWQKNEIIYPLYGWFHPDGTRRYSNAIIFCPKKVGKTTLLAGLSLYHLLEYPGSEAYCIASDVKQASVLFNQAADFVELYEPLASRLWVKRHVKTIQHEAQKSVFSVLSSKPEGKSGFSANFVAYDELAEWNGTNARTIWDRLTEAGMARQNSLQIVISTAQYDKTHLGYEQYRYACDIKDEKIQDIHTLPVIYSLPEDKDWRNEENWWPIVPSIGQTVTKDKYYRAYEKTKNNPQEETKFRTFFLCQWVGHSQQWVASDRWAACKSTYAESDLHGLNAIVGLDMARRYDLASYVLLVPKDGKIHLLPRFFIPEQLAKQKEKADKVTYSQWAKRGYITMTGGDVIDPSVIRDHLLKDKENFNIQEIRYDPYGFEETRQLLEAEGLTLLEVGQTYGGMSPATAHLERLILDKKLVHNDNPCLNWCLGNCTTRTDNHDRIMVDKMRSKGRIDGIVACIIGLTGLLAVEQEPVFTGDWVG